MTGPDPTVDAGATVVSLRGVSRSFGTSMVLAPTDLAIARGDYAAISGPSGSGKSTLLHLLGLLDTPTEGTYLFAGEDVADLDDVERAALRGRSIGFVFQAFHLLAERTAVENVELGMLYQAVPRRVRRSRALNALEQVGLAHRLQAFPTTLSGGEQQRVAIARALAANASLLLADEPTGNLDTRTGERILDLFDELHGAGLTIVVITHDADVASRAQSQHWLRDGVLRPGEPLVAGADRSARG